MVYFICVDVCECGIAVFECDVCVWIERCEVERTKSVCVINVYVLICVCAETRDQNVHNKCVCERCMDWSTCM